MGILMASIRIEFGKDAPAFDLLHRVCKHGFPWEKLRFYAWAVWLTVAPCLVLVCFLRIWALPRRIGKSEDLLYQQVGNIVALIYSYGGFCSSYALWLVFAMLFLLKLLVMLHQHNLMLYAGAVNA